MPQQTATTHVLMYRELVLYRRPRSLVWQCRLKVNHQWIRATTKEYDFDKARIKAKELFIEAEIRRRNNLLKNGLKLLHKELNLTSTQNWCLTFLIYKGYKKH